jgi:hypothetical protein
LLFHTTDWNKPNLIRLIHCRAHPGSTLKPFFILHDVSIVAIVNLDGLSSEIAQPLLHAPAEDLKSLQ